MIYMLRHDKIDALLPNGRGMDFSCENMENIDYNMEENNAALRRKL